MPKIPTHPEELSPKWLTEVFRLNGLLDEGSVERVRQAAAAGGNAGTSRVIRLFLEFNGPHEGVPDTMVAKIRHPDWRYDTHIYQPELRYYNELSSVPPIVAPRCYYSDGRQEDGAFVFLLEDLTPCRPGHRLEGLSVEEASDALGQLAAFHAAWWEHTDLVQLGWPIKTWTPQLARQKSQLYQALQPTLTKNKGFRWPQGYGWIAEGLESTLEDDILHMAKLPLTLIHGDLSNQNFLLDQHRGLVAIDWQRVSLGPFVVDVAHLLFSLEPDCDLRKHMDELSERYQEALFESGVRDRSFTLLRQDMDSAVRYYFSKWAIARARAKKAFDRREPLSLRI